MPSAEANDIAGLRDQILDNAKTIFPHYYKGITPITDPGLILLMYGADTNVKGMTHPTMVYTAEMVWDPYKKPFLAGPSSICFSPQAAFEGLLAVMTKILFKLKVEDKLECILTQETMVFEHGGMIVTEPAINWNVYG